MCGIFAAISSRCVEELIISGLERLEYRGYDSAGIGVIDQDNKLQCLKVVGKVKNLRQALDNNKISGTVGIAHTRWATHGMPAEINAHPMISHQQIALVHNGIIENSELLKADLISYGYHFTSHTDTEVIVHYLHWHYNKTQDFILALRNTVSLLKGSYALAIISVYDPAKIFLVKNSSPLVVGIGKEENFIASDALALLPLTKNFIYLEDGNIAEISSDNIAIYDSSDKKVIPEVYHINEDYEIADRGSYPYYMRKEIADQADALISCFMGRINKNSVTDLAFPQELQQKFAQLKHVYLVACGTSYHAALTAKYWLEAIAKISCTVEIASEFRYRQLVVHPDTLFVVLSQSGETADTLAALQLAEQLNFMTTLAICNVPESSITRQAEHVFFMRAGAEIGVASTKAFTTQLVSLLLLAVSIAKRQNKLLVEQELEIIDALHALPSYVSAISSNDKEILRYAQHFIDKDHALFIARGSLYPIAMEGALKLKEISYIHAEAYPGGELKHGPLALVDNNMPVVALAPQHYLLFDKIKSNIASVVARGGTLYVLTDVVNHFDHSGVYVVNMPHVNSIIAPIVYSVPLQLLAYHVALLKGANVDQPRNLAKSVTVE